MYAILTNILLKFFKPHQIYKYGFNWSSMYRRTTGKIVDVSEDLLSIKIKIPLSYKNRNYVGTIFGGSMTSATDPIYMIQLMNILGKGYVVWDKSSSIKFKRPARETIFGHFEFTAEEIEDIKSNISTKNELNILKKLNLTNDKGDVVFAELDKTIYVANKQFYKEKQKRKKLKAIIQA